MSSPPPETANGGNTNQTYRQKLRDILTDEERETSAKIQAVLQIGVDRLDVEHGHLTRIDPAAGTHQITEVSGPHPCIEQGAIIDLSNSYCRIVLAENEPLLLENAPEQGWDDDPAYGKFGLGTYLGAKVIVSGQLYGTVCFVDRETRDEAFTDADRALLEAIAQGIGREIERARREGELQKARHRLEQTERLLRRTQEVAHVGGWRYDPDRDLVVGTVQFSNLFGFPPHEARRLDDWLNRFPPTARNTVQAALRRCLNDGTAFDVEVPYRPAASTGNDPSEEGERRWGRLRGHRDEGEDGGLFGTFQDVSDQKEQEQELNLFKQVVEQANDSILITEAEPLDEPGPRIEYVNPAFEEMTGYDADELLGRTPRVLQGPDTDRAVLDSLRDALENETSWEGETINYRKDQTPYQLRWSVAPVRDEQGHLEHWISIQRDVTEERARENELRRQRNLLNQTQRLAGAWEVDLRTEEVSWSETVYEIHEVAPGTEIDLDTALDYFPASARTELRNAFQRCIDEEEPYDLELPLITAEGNERWVRTVGAPAETSDGEITKVAGAFQDITERKEEERRREQVIRRVTDAIVKVDANWRFTLVNDQAETLYDMTEEELLGKNFWDVFEEALGTRFEDTYRAVMETREPASLMEYYSGLDGWFDITAYPNDDGGLAFYFQEVTEQKQQEARLRDLSNSVPGVVFQFFARPDGTYGNYFVSEHAEDVLGISPEPETFFERCLEQIPDSHRDAFRASVEKAVEEETPWEFETPFDKPSGERRWILGRSVPRKRNGEVVFNGVLLDITDRKEAERDLRQSERRFRKIFKNAAIGIVIGNADGRLLRANPAFQSMLGYEEEELEGLHFSEITHPDDVESDLDLFEELITGKRDRYQIEKRYVRKDGEVFWARLTVSLLGLDDEKKPIALVEDINEQKHYEEQLRKAKNEAEEASRLKSVMLANMSHEVRTPLTSMIGFSGLLEKQLDGKSAKLARLIHKSGQRLEQTLEAVLQLSELEAGSYTLDRETLRLNSLVERIADEFELQARESGVTLAVETADDSVTAYADDTAVRRLLSNLLDNALKFTPEGGRVTIRTRMGNSDMAVLEVEDTGVGIADEALPDVFNAFKQESEGMTREYEGAGLGLSIVRELIEALGGRIDVDSEKGEGSRFTVWLPRT